MTNNIIYTDRMSIDELHSLMEIAKKAIRECTTLPRYEYWTGIEFEVLMELKRRSKD